MNKLNNEKNHCPLCGGLNQCQSEMAKTCQEGTCWCRAETFPSTLLTHLPEEERNMRCICLSCLKAFETQKTKS